ncbi:hypothetical protein U1Q18_025990 [Sarracenia purpurea var. burkii]
MEIGLRACWFCMPEKDWLAIKMVETSKFCRGSGVTGKWQHDSRVVMCSCKKNRVGVSRDHIVSFLYDIFVYIRFKPEGKVVLSDNWKLDCDLEVVLDSVAATKDFFVVV